ncbi:MAG: GGDEF domain-containing protein [Desulfobacula sp.]|uniref:GGDEF domain-containing protein n=1 Tax=Desulfobacula sp. TaxID=2593537 RepID=UPI001DF74E95|nr:GGDEF domain-containing protein [Desulfobacula sp.]MBT3484317.1 GGDEF domain-containing protein [Desulfobacula sp.]MBT3805042.1 GGDEF domain-containing protein [Desulfobacula sp.]MBT4024126.1 GGDEF domain-containing protein [Desulfobacula sp.]MBT4197450.1 GGDEF domain-containing protein [Desulfobacula sp.]
MKISHLGIKLSVAVLLGLILISYTVYWKAISTLSDHMTSLAKVSNHLTNGEIFHSSVHSMLMDIADYSSKIRYGEDSQRADAAILKLQTYLDHMAGGVAKKMVSEITARMAKEHIVFKDYTEQIIRRENSITDIKEVQQAQNLFNNIFIEYKKLHHHHNQMRNDLDTKTQSIRKSIRIILLIQIAIACIVGLLVIVYLDRMVLKVFDLTEKLALHDKLTGLYNRHGLGRIVSELENPRSGDRKAYGIALLDIDHFKRFNDNYGHPAGDQLLVCLADVLLKAVRAQDRVIRFGGEEILIILSRTDISGTRQVARKICDIVAGTAFDLKDGKEPKQVTVSIGYAAVSHDGGSFHDLTKIADERLYEAKNSGRNRSVGP